MKKYMPTICGLLAGFLFGVCHLLFSFNIISPLGILLYAAIGGLIGFGVGAFWPAVARMKISSPIWWFVGCTVLVLLAFVGGSESMTSYYLLPVGVLGMVISLILLFIPRMSAAERIVSPASIDAKQKHPTLLSFLCIAHAAFLTAAVYFAFKYSALIGSSGKILGVIWLILLIAWPFWIVVFLMNGWKVQRIMITMIVGLFILSPLFLWFLVVWSLGHGASLG
jgi:hypothetical protein